MQASNVVHGKTLWSGQDIRDGARDRLMVPSATCAIPSVLDSY